MNTLPSEGAKLAQQLLSVSEISGAEMIIFPPFTHISDLNRVFSGSFIQTGAQNASDFESGAYTGEISVNMLRDLGATAVLIGHSERRQYFGETNSLLARKVSRVLASGLKPVYCIGETLEERESGTHWGILEKQLTEGLFHLTDEEMEPVIVAYEPVWAIGTGRTASPEQAQEVHAFIRKMLASKFMPGTAAQTRILYGGSVKGSNAADLFVQPDIDGGLVGGASLDVVDFEKIYQAAADAYDKK